MKTIEILHQIRDSHGARVLFFDPPAKPIPEGLDEISRVTDYDEVTEEYHEWERPRLLVDMHTANVICLVYDAVSKDSTREKMDRLMLSKTGFIKVTHVCWKFVS